MRAGTRTSALLAALLLLVATACGDPAADAEAARLEALVADAEEVALLMADRDYAAVTARFDETLELSPEGLGDIWEQFDDSLGGFQELAADSATGFGGDVDIVDTPLRFASDVIKQRITYDEDGDIAGYFLLLLSAPLPQETPTP